jgi:RNase H-fold protein (predicted Holliday junction resolvase)
MELQARIDKMTALNNVINNLLASTEIGTIFLNSNLGIKRFTPSMKENVVDGVVITFVDITYRKRALEQIRAAKNFAERIVDTVHSPLLILDPDLKVISANCPVLSRIQDDTRRNGIRAHL